MLKFPINMGRWDRGTRIVLGIALFLWGMFGALSSGTTLLVYIIGAVMLLTGIVGFCPAYSLFRVSSDHGWHRIAH